MIDTSTQEQIELLQKEITDRRKQIRDLRKNKPLEKVEDVALTKRNGEQVMLSSLFHDRNELLVIHNMGKGCVYCTMWADGLRGYTTMLQDRMPFVLVSPDAYSVLDQFATDRNWSFNAVSAKDTDFIRSMGFQYEKEGKTYYQPGVSALIMKDGVMYRSNYDYFGPGDTYCPPWHFFDLFPAGSDGWQPKYSYKR